MAKRKKASFEVVERRRASRKARKKAKRDKPWKLAKPAPPPPVLDIDQARDALLVNLATMPLDQRERDIDREDVVALLTPAQHRTVKKEITEARARMSEEVTALQRRCCCRFCVANRRRPLPAYYVPNFISFECALNRNGDALAADIDEEFAEIFEELRGSSVSLLRSSGKYKGRSHMPL